MLQSAVDDVFRVTQQRRHYVVNSVKPDILLHELNRRGVYIYGKHFCHARAFCSYYGEAADTREHVNQRFAFFNQLCDTHSFVRKPWRKIAFCHVNGEQAAEFPVNCDGFVFASHIS